MKTSKGKTKKRTRGDTLANMSLPQDAAEDQMIPTQSMGLVSKQAEDKPSTSMKFRSRSAGEEAVTKSEDSIQDQIILAPESLQKIADQAENGPTFYMKLRSRDVMFHIQEDRVQDQIILAPEIMNMILDQLDLRSLKQVRLVCKSWLLEAQAHMRRRAIVRLESGHGTERISSFIQQCRKKLSTLPNPFESIDFDLSTLPLYQDCGNNHILRVLKSLRPPLVVTRFSTEEVPLKLTLPLIIKWSSGLEFLKLEATGYEAGNMPPMNEEHKFPKLRHLCASPEFAAHSNAANWKHFHSLLAWLVNNSPSLEAFESINPSDLDLTIGNEPKVDLTNVKMLTFTDWESKNAALKYFLGIRFSRLEILNIHLITATPSTQGAIVATVENSATTLKSLHLDDYNERLPYLEFPVCHNLEELTLNSFGPWKLSLSNSFPSLRGLNLSSLDVDVLAEFWRELRPFVFLETLRVQVCSGSNLYELPVKFFEKFPSLERLKLDPKFLLHCCQLKASGDARFPKVLDSVRHLELYSYDVQEDGLDYSLLRFLKGIETVAGSLKEVIQIPFRDMPSLKVLQFPFPELGNIIVNKLLEMAQGMEKVVVTNCCSIRRDDDQEATDALNTFFDSVPHAECGCGTSKKNLTYY